jgi:N-acetyl-S-(2-succino)cysteine monooxygenase
MTAASRRMHLGVFVLGTGNHSAGWRYEGAFDSHMELSAMQEIARIAERGKFDLLFISDSMSMDPTDHPSFMCRLEPTSLITALAGCTTHVGLGATVSTSFSEPFNVARMFGSIDHISGGRAAWNVVTSSNAKAALNFNLDEHIEHELRYARANEFVDVVRGLWDCWEDGAIVADKVTGQYVDAAKVRPLNHKGRFFKVRGPLNMARCPQGHPVIIPRPAARPLGWSWQRAPRMWCFRWCRSLGRPRLPMRTSRAAWRNTAATRTSLRCCPA